MIDETIIQTGSHDFRLWFCIEPVHSSVPWIYIPEDRNMIVHQKFIQSLFEKYGKHTVYTDGGIWYPEACNVLGLKYYLHSSCKKSLKSQTIF